MCRISCPICQSTQSRLLCRKQEMDVVQCRQCNTAFVPEIPDKKTLESLYDQQYFKSDEPSIGYRDYARISEQKRLTFTKRLERIERLSDGRNLLDVGCATGLFVDIATSRGWTAAGIDVSEFAIKEATAHYSGAFMTGDLMTADFPAGSFDTITMFDVIEHVPQPLEVLLRIADLLSDRGILVIETPNVGGFMAKVMRQRWPYYRPPEHLFYFSPSSLQVALNKSRFKLLSWSKSMKTMQIGYIVEMLQLTNPGLARILSGILSIFPGFSTWVLNVPTGSFLAFARLT